MSGEQRVYFSRWAQGASEAASGFGRDACPFKQGTLEARDWLMGWDAWARDEKAGSSPQPAKAKQRRG